MVSIWTAIMAIWQDDKIMYDYIPMLIVMDLVTLAAGIFIGVHR